MKKGFCFFKLTTTTTTTEGERERETGSSTHLLGHPVAEEHAGVVSHRPPKRRRRSRVQPLDPLSCHGLPEAVDHAGELRVGVRLRLKSHLDGVERVTFDGRGKEGRGAQSLDHFGDGPGVVCGVCHRIRSQNYGDFAKKR